MAIYITLHGRKKVLTSVLDSLLLHSWLQSGTKIGIKNPIPYISGIFETIACILQTKNQFVAAITNVRDKDKLQDRQGAGYKIKKTTVSLDVLFTCQIPSKGS